MERAVLILSALLEQSRIETLVGCWLCFMILIESCRPSYLKMPLGKERSGEERVNRGQASERAVCV